MIVKTLVIVIGGQRYEFTIAQNTIRRSYCNFDMKRRLLFCESKHEESELVLDEMLALEEKNPYYGKFNLSMMKFGSQVSRKKYNNEVFLKKLDSIYEIFDVKKDLKYYGYKRDMGVFTPQYLNLKLIALKSELKNINISFVNLEKNKAKVSILNNNILSLILLFIITAIALIILIDTFKSPISIFIPSIEFFLYNFYESVKDIILFFKDLL